MVLLSDWELNPTATIHSLATHFEVDPDLVRVQLLRALIDRLSTGEPNSDVPPVITLEQRAIAHREGCPTLLDAGPGTGKTTTILERVRWLLTDAESKPDSVLVLSFSNAAVDTLRSRMLHQFPALVDRVDISTVHSFALEVVRRHLPELSLKRMPGVIDDVEIRSHIHRLLLQGYLPNSFDPFALQQSIEKVQKAWERRQHETAAELDDPASDAEQSPDTKSNDEDEQKFDAAFKLARQAENRWTFRDFIESALTVLRDAKNAKKWAKKYSRVIVDEVQDLSVEALDLVLSIAPAQHDPWFAGDHRQRLYGYLGAPSDLEKRLRNTYGQHLQVEYLGDNHRASDHEVRRTNDLARHVDTSAHKQWRCVSGRKSPNWFADKYSAPDMATAVETAVKCVRNRLTSGHWSGIPLESIAVLVKRNEDARCVRDALIAAGIPAYVPGSIDLDGPGGDLLIRLAPGAYGAASISLRDALRSCEFNQDSTSDFALEPEKLGSESQILNVPTVSDDTRSFESLCEIVFDRRVGLAQALAQSSPMGRAAVAQIVTALSIALEVNCRGAGGAERTHCARLLRFHATRRPARVADSVVVRGAVQVMTVHQAKGREFDHIVTLLSPQWKPREKRASGNSTSKWDSDTCLVFVAMTRAREQTELIQVGGSSLHPPITQALKANKPCSAPAKKTDRQSLAYQIGSLGAVPSTLVIEAGLFDGQQCEMRAYFDSLFCPPPANNAGRTLNSIEQALVVGLLDRYHLYPVNTSVQTSPPTAPALQNIVEQMLAAAEPRLRECNGATLRILPDYVDMENVSIKNPFLATIEQPLEDHATLVYLGPSARRNERAVGHGVLVRQLEQLLGVSLEVLALTVGPTNEDSHRKKTIEAARSSSNTTKQSKALIASLASDTRKVMLGKHCDHCPGRLVCPAYLVPDGSAIVVNENGCAA